ncbi:MAG: aspartate kinase [Bacteroidota bacterium]
MSVPQTALSPKPTTTRSAPSLSLYLAGVGSVGTALLYQLSELQGDAQRPRLIGACTSTHAAWTPPHPTPGAVKHHLEHGSTLHWPAVLERLIEHAPRPLVFVDATGHPDVADHYTTLLDAGIHVVTPSKLANTRSQQHFDRLHATAAQHNVQYRYETTVGAGLPVVRTVRDLRATGDRIHTIRGAVSGTLTFVFSRMREGDSFSEAVRTAIQKGYAEPDIRDDLSGEDVARKFLILARTAGASIDREDVEVESLVPESLRNLPHLAFRRYVHKANDAWRERAETAASQDAVLQYVGRWTPGSGIRVGVEAVPADSDFGQLEGQDNLFTITTNRYAASPLTIRGPGAGPEVTAAGVLADVLHVAETA